jgi:biopolymer transport protein TolQ
MVKLVIVVLLFFSVFSWAIIIFKHRHLVRAEREDMAFYKAFRKVNTTGELFAVSKKYFLSPMANVFKAVFPDSERREREDISRSLKRFEALETAKLEKYLNFLATTGSTTPFIGLFGTVWGIMNSFRGIGQAGAASLAIVAPGIAEALIATAMGLLAAIPAVIAYNYYLSRARRITIQMEDFSEEALALFARELRRKRQEAKARGASQGQGAQ